MESKITNFILSFSFHVFFLFEDKFNLKFVYFIKFLCFYFLHGLFNLSNAY